MRRPPHGFTMVETLASLAILVITIMVVVPTAAERLRTARIRVAAKQLSLDLRAARLKAVSNRTAIDVIVTSHPGSGYRYTEPSGRTREIPLPSGVQIVSSTSPIRFAANGSVAGGASTVLEADLSGSSVDRWTITTSFLGIPRITHERVLN